MHIIQRSFALFLLAATCLAEARVGQPAPDFSVADINGRTHRLADYRGKIVVLEAFNPDCPFTANQYHSGSLPTLQAAVVSKGVVWLVVDSAPRNGKGFRTADAARKDMAALGIKATAWLDDSAGTLGKAYGLKTTPEMVVINAQGVVAYVGAVDDKADANADPRTAHNHVRGAVEALLTGKPVPLAETKPYGTSIQYGN